MGNQRVYNFSAGPSMLPLEVLTRAGSQDTKARFIKLFHVPDNYKVLFLQGGASGQFSMVPLNLIGKTGKADYAVTGNFSNIAYKEAKKYGQINLAASSEDQNHTYIPTQDQLKLDPEASYFHYCANNTIYGTEWQYVPDTGDVPLVCDMSSDFMSRVVDVSKYGIIYGGAQKNLAPAGLTIAIVREDLAGHELPYTPGPGGPHHRHCPGGFGGPRAALHPPHHELQDHDRQGLHVQHTPLLVHLHAGAGAGVAGRAGWCGRHGEDQARQGPAALRRAGRLQAVHLPRPEGEPRPPRRALSTSRATATWEACGPPSTTPCPPKGWRSWRTSSGPLTRSTAETGGNHHVSYQNHE